MKKIAIIIVALVSCVLMNAQDAKVKSRLELKGGKADVVGYAEQQADGGYVIETESGDVFYYSADEIKRISQIDEVAVKVKTRKSLPDVSSDRSKTRGYMGIVEAALGYPGGTLSIVNGYRFSQHFYLGVGLGGNVGEGLNIPVFLQARAEFTKRKVSPYIAFNGGVSYSEYYYYDGYHDIYEMAMLPYLEASFGVRSYLKRHGSMWYGVSAGIMADDFLAMIKIAYSF